MNDTMQLVVTGLSYALFHVGFFRYVAYLLQHKNIKMIHMMWTFSLNYTVFIVCSVLHFHLILNWLIFLVMLCFEIRLLFSKLCKESLLLSLLGCLLGLAVNIFLRSLFAMLLNIPLVAFDNELIPGNMKVYPIILSFACTGIFFCFANRQLPFDRMRLILNDRLNIIFLLSLLGAMYLYLSMNLVVYYNGGNSIIVKLWSMKSSLFVIVGEVLAVTLSISMGQINEYRKENTRAKQILEEEKHREQELRVIAILDPLTGCENQAESLKYMEQLYYKKEAFVLAFIDLNCLKLVNDQYGHEMGDVYLLSVSSTLRTICYHNDKLFRYGGDEFLMVFQEIDEAAAMDRLQLAQLNLQQLALDTPFKMSFSYGISHSQKAENVKELIDQADQSMYEMKQRMRLNK